MIRAKVAVLISGSGTNMAALLYAAKHPSCPYEIVLVAANDPAAKNLKKIFHAEDLVTGPGAIFCATGITSSWLLPGVKLVGRRATTYSILMRARSRSAT